MATAAATSVPTINAIGVIAASSRAGEDRSAARQAAQLGHAAGRCLDHLADLDDASGAVGRAVDVHDDVDAPAQVVADGGQRPRRHRLHDERLEPVQGVEGAVGVARRHRPVVAGVQRLDEADHLGAAHLADHQAVGAQAQRRVEQSLERYGGGALGAARARFQADQVVDGGVQFGGVLERDDAFAGTRAGEQAAQERRLSRGGGAGDDGVATAVEHLVEQRGHSVGGERGQRQRPLPEPSQRQAGAADGDRLDDRAHARTIGQAGVDDRGGAVDRRPSGARMRSITTARSPAAIVPARWSSRHDRPRPRRRG